MGRSEDGKSTLMEALAKMFCIRAKLQTFVLSKGLDPLGLLTRSREVKHMGAFCFHDFTLTTNRCEQLGEEAIKGLLQSEEAASCPACYHEAVLPEALLGQHGPQRRRHG